MKTCPVVILSVLLFLLFACGADREEKKAPSEEKEAATTAMKTYTFNWTAICRCEGTTETPGGKLCNQTGTYDGRYPTEEEAVEKMKEEVHKQLNCLEGPFLAFRYETP